MTGQARAGTDVEFRNVTKRYGDIIAVDEVDLAIPSGGFFSFLGPSGCGKTTSLRMIAGFEQPTSGDVLIQGHSVVGIPAYRRPVNMVFQHYALFPHLNVFDNVAYGLKQTMAKPEKAELARRVGEALELVQLAGYERRRSWQLSGGQQQRVALARALINQPTVLLLDEPLAALDRKLRRDMQIELQTIQREVGITFILVTHDQEEALSMSDRVCTMLEGRIIQVGSPTDLYDEPVNRYVADFVGRSNFLGGRVVSSDAEGAKIETDTGKSFAGRTPSGVQSPARGEIAVVAIRPEMIHIARAEESHALDGEVTAFAKIKNRIFLGEQTEYLVEAEGVGEVHVRAPKHVEARTGGFAPGDRVLIGWREESVLVLEDN